ncbi:MAG: Glutamate synthase (NADPH) small chain [Pelotomaculum sp. PtaB.Bin013]|uniref:FAD-dependent oxidoreductase n=1 Tax=Pelotomaculum isophthalicicum JI TaxID=947010 RepID=A0A9X4H4J1_9FIRM|nr:FAD-dependent oxidoreductase [Pelotomaculum isophthalicicum]MDF9409841.1 FAD-dependent oxidoreductase [Pelotomaculum isophthalicicum JI]OPX91400.1 MAG: Glutamate synthase (NADPH) small chain [Pelotomaculum sp. PtaB.Bin013]
MDMIKLTIDGNPVEVEPGVTLLEAARGAGIYIPALCSHPDVPPGGVCGLCAVELAGRDDLVQACEVKAEAGMVVLTGTSKVKDYRRDKLAAIMAGHPHSCLTCAQREGCSRSQCSSGVAEKERCCPNLGNCELQRVANYVGIKSDTGRYQYLDLPVISDEPLIARDLNLCIGCQRCLRVCRDVRGVDALQLAEIKGRTVVMPKEGTLAESGCRFCTACVEVCPTGALTDKDMSGKANEATIVPCRSSCPAGIDVPAYVRYIAEEKFDEALGVLREKTPFPASLGRVCFHPCEESCRRGRINESVSICRLKRFVADEDSGWWRKQLNAALPTGRNVAVIGAGPAGLTCAYYLARMGHDVTVFEALPVAGGMMAVGIPDYRLPKDVLAKEIKIIEDMGVVIKTNTRFGKDITLNELKRRSYDIVYFAIGAHNDQKLGIPGEEMDGVVSGISMLRDVKLGSAQVLNGKIVLVVGGGNVAMDSARTALRLGAQEVHVIYRRSKEEMPALEEEILEAESEGVIFDFLTAPVRVLGNDGKIAELECQRMELGDVDASGRRRPVPVEDSNFVMKADMLISAIGQEVQTDYLSELGLEIERGLIVVDKENACTSIQGIYAGGDAVRGPKSVTEAIGDGRKAAKYIDMALGGDGEVEEEIVKREKPDLFIGNMPGFASLKRPGQAKRPWNSANRTAPCLAEEVVLAKFSEVELNMTEDMAVGEANRCLRCDLRLLFNEVPAPPDSWLEFNEENVAKVPNCEGVYQLLNADKIVIAIVGTATLRETLEEQLESPGNTCYFGYEEDPMFTSRQSQLLQMFLQEYGHLPEGNGEDDDLF